MESDDKVRISELEEDSSLSGGESVPISDFGLTKRTTVSAVKDFVAAKFAELTNADSVSVNSDGVYLKKDGELKPVAANVFADAIIAFMFGKEAENELADTDEIVVNKDGVAKKTTVADFAGIVKEIVNPPGIDIASLDDAGYSQQSDIDGFIAITKDVEEDGGTETKTFKTHVTNVCKFIVNYWMNDGNTIFIYPTLGENDSIVVAQEYDDGGERKRRLALCSKAVLGIKDGDVKGPSTTTNGKIPLWDKPSSDSPDRVLKDGLFVVEEIKSTSGSTEIPTAASVYEAVKNKVVAPSENSDGKIPQWDGANSKTLKDGLEFVPGTGTGEDTAKVPSVRAMNEAIEGSIDDALEGVDEKIGLTAKAPNSTTEGYIPQWDSTAKSLKNGKSVSGSISSISTDDQIPTAKAVYDAIKDVAKAPSSTTGGKVPQWDTASGKLKDGLSVETSVPIEATDSQILTAKAAKEGFVGSPLAVEHESDRLYALGFRGTFSGSASEEIEVDDGNGTESLGAIATLGSVRDRINQWVGSILYVNSTGLIESYLYSEEFLREHPHAGVVIQGNLTNTMFIYFKHEFNSTIRWLKVQGTYVDPS